ncbi:hypothetical protein AB5I41_03415 [Sphingomonas sp. MMS24-JH45]
MSSGSHIGPAEAALVHHRLGAARSIPIHWGTFAAELRGIRHAAPAAGGGDGVFGRRRVRAGGDGAAGHGGALCRTGGRAGHGAARDARVPRYAGGREMRMNPPAVVEPMMENSIWTSSKRRRWNVGGPVLTRRWLFMARRRSAISARRSRWC